MEEQNQQQPNSTNPITSMPTPPPTTQPTPMPTPNPSPMSPPEMMRTPKIKLNKNLIIIGVAILVILITGILIFVNLGSSNILSLLTGNSKEVVAKKAIDYLNSSVLQPGQTAILGNVSEESGVVKFQVKIGSNSYDSYVTKNGKLFFPQAYSLAGQTADNNNQPTSAQIDIKNVKVEGEPFVGKADAPVVMAYWFDYQCPFCKKNDQEVIPQLVNNYVNTGKLKIVFKDYAFLGDDSKTAALAARAVWEIAPNRFYELHKAMFSKQDNENGGWGSKSDILALTASLGIDSSRVDQLMTQKAAEYQKSIDADKAEGTGFGINGTPGTIVGKQKIDGAQPYDNFKSAIEEVLKSK